MSDLEDSGTFLKSPQIYIKFTRFEVMIVVIFPSLLLIEVLSILRNEKNKSQNNVYLSETKIISACSYNIIP